MISLQERFKLAMISMALKLTNKEMNNELNDIFIQAINVPQIVTRNPNIFNIDLMPISNSTQIKKMAMFTNEYRHHISLEDSTITNKARIKALMIARLRMEN